MSDPLPIGEYARRLATAKISEAPSVAVASEVLVQLQKIADTNWETYREGARQAGISIACRPGCDHCCHEPIKVSMLEAIVLAGHVQAHFTAEDRDALGKRGEAYRLKSRLEESVIPCPFLVEGQCSVYELRPLPCRGTHSTDVDVCKARLGPDKPDRPCAKGYVDECFRLEEGLNFATPGRVYPDSLELGLLAEQIANGAYQDSHILSALECKDRPNSKPEEPSGFSLYTPRDISPYLDMRDNIDMEGALTQANCLDDSARRLLDFVMPLTYETVEQAEEWWHKAEMAMWLLENREVTPAVAFDTMPYHSTYPLGYSEKPLRELYSRYGRWVLDRVLNPLFPDLVAPIEAPRRPGRIRVGYASTELGFRNGAMWSLGWLQSHGPDIETYVINLGNLEDCITQRFVRSADHYLRFAGNVPSAARGIRALDLDLLIFPGVGESGRATQFASMRLARNQATGWGYPATSGLPNMDFYLCGDDMLHAGSQVEFTERLVRLPNSGLILDEPYRPAGPDNLPPLPGEYYLMGHNLAKLHPRYDWVWAEISRRADRGIVMAQNPSPGLTRIVKKRLADVGARVFWLPFQNQNQFERLMAGSIACLDPQIWTGGYTAFQAMKLGTPVITLPGDSMRTRLSVAFMRQAGGDDLIASSPEQYIEMVCDRDRLRSVRQRIDRGAVFGDHRVAEALDTFVKDCV